MSDNKLRLVIASRRLFESDAFAGYVYREEPDHPNDSGWRVMVGDETEEDVDDADAFGMYSESDLTEITPHFSAVIETPWPCEFERDGSEDEFVRVDHKN